MKLYTVDASEHLQALRDFIRLLTAQLPQVDATGCTSGMSISSSNIDTSFESQENLLAVFVSILEAHPMCQVGVLLMCIVMFMCITTTYHTITYILMPIKIYIRIKVCVYT